MIIPFDYLSPNYVMIKLAALNGQPEIFHTIQGEGKSTGIPSIFIRTSLCNLHCIWCDTDYTWNWEGTSFRHVNDTQPGYRKFSKADWIIETGFEQILSLLSTYPCKHIVITGGEPLIQQAPLATLMNLLTETSTDYFFEVETNGTLLPDTAFDSAINQYNVSPKLENSGNPYQLRIRPKVLKFFAESPKSNFKFVIEKLQDLNEVLQLINDFQINQEQVILMPEGTSAPHLSEKRQWLVEQCKQYNFRYSDRLHIQIYGPKRGV